MGGQALASVTAVVAASCCSVAAQTVTGAQTESCRLCWCQVTDISDVCAREWEILLQQHFSSAAEWMN